MDSDRVVDLERTRHLSRVIGTVVGRLAPTPVPYAEPDQRLIEDLGYHSLALVELTFLLEEMFTLEQIEPEEAARITVVGDVTAYLASVLDPAVPLPSEQEVADLVGDFSLPPET
jgi:acyl carrier protein